MDHRGKNKVVRLEVPDVHLIPCAAGWINEVIGLCVSTLLESNNLVE